MFSWLADFFRALAGLAPVARDVRDIADGKGDDLDKAVAASEAASKIADSITAASAPKK